MSRKNSRGCLRRGFIQRDQLSTAGRERPVENLEPSTRPPIAPAVLVDRVAYTRRMMTIGVSAERVSATWRGLWLPAF